LGYGLGWGLGLGLYGWGLGGYGGWGYGGYGGYGYGGYGGYGYGDYGYGYNSPYYDWGYSQYVNPYTTYVVTVPVVVDANGNVISSYDYSRPIGAQTAAAAAPAAEDQALSLFDQARAAFGRSDYVLAQQLVDQALVKLPEDANLHEFRALTLFAQGKYEEAASVVFAVLSVGPGWNWSTMIGLYPDPGVYTQQIRALEAYRNAHPEQPAARFLLAYHYVTQGHDKAAIDELRAVVRNQPNDTVSAHLLEQLERKNGIAPTHVETSATVPAPGGGPSPPAPAAGDNARPAASGLQPALGRQFPLTGVWHASPSADTQITLTVQDSGFSWLVNQNGHTTTIRGASAVGSTGLLTLAGDENQGTLVGNVTWTDPSHFHFKLSDGPPNDPGLDFTRTP
jgi:hypothetical protein